MSRAVASQRVQPEAWDPATRAGRWEYLSMLGEGSYGVIWKVRDMKHEKKLYRALKVSKFDSKGASGYMLHREFIMSERIHNYYKRKMQENNPAPKASSKARSSSRQKNANKNDNDDNGKSGPLKENNNTSNKNSNSNSRREPDSPFMRVLEDHTSYRNNTPQQDQHMESEVKIFPKPRELDHMRPGAIKADDVDYVVMELLEGCTFREKLRTHGFTLPQMREVLQDAAQALHCLGEVEKVQLLH
eukprot:gene210-146_t